MRIKKNKKRKRDDQKNDRLFLFSKKLKSKITIQQKIFFPTSDDFFNLEMTMKKKNNNLKLILHLKNHLKILINFYKSILLI